MQATPAEPRRYFVLCDSAEAGKRIAGYASSWLGKDLKVLVGRDADEIQANLKVLTTTTAASVSLVVELSNSLEHNARFLTFVKEAHRSLERRLCEVWICHGYREAPPGFGAIVSFIEDLRSKTDPALRLIVVSDYLRSGEKSSGTKHPYTIVDLRLNVDTFPQATFVPRQSILIPDSLAQTVLRDHVVGQEFWYWDEYSTATYLSVMDSATYNVLDENVDFLGLNLRHALSSVFEYFKGQNSGNLPPLDFVALGVGSAKKELKILNSIATHPEIAALQDAVKFVPVDTSFPLLQNSLRALFATSELSRRIASGKLIVEPFLSDFNELEPGLVGEDRYKLIAALGIVWNAPVPKVLENLRNLLDRKSLLLIDVEFVADRENDEVAKSYKGPEMASFFYHPLDLLHRASQTDLTFRDKSLRAERPYSRYFSEFGLDSGQVEVEVVRPGEFDRFTKENGLTASGRAELGFAEPRDFENSKTVMVMFKPKTRTDSCYPVVLGHSTRFLRREFENAIDRVGLQRVKTLYEKPEDVDHSIFGYYLLSGPKSS